MAGETSDFGPGPLDDAQVRDVDPLVKAIDALDEASADKAYADAMAALEAKKKMEGVKKALAALGAFVRPFLPIP
jgi:hypothetical protein